MIKTVMALLSTLTFIGDLMLVAFIVLLTLQFFFKINYLKKVRTLIHPYVFYGIFLVSLIATAGSLFFSEIAKFQPCLLCWYQRILMYPQVILLYVGILRNEKVLVPYLYVLNTIGALIAGYHYLIQRMPSLEVFPCKLGEISCTKFGALHYGYITIPMMSLTAFLLNIVLLSFVSKRTREQESKRAKKTN